MAEVQFPTSGVVSTQVEKILIHGAFLFSFFPFFTLNHKNLLGEQHGNLSAPHVYSLEVIIHYLWSKTNCVNEFTSTFLIAMEAENSEAANTSLLVTSFGSAVSLLADLGSEW